jgi:hypothetical protein
MFCSSLCDRFVILLMLKIAYLVQDVLFKLNITHPKQMAYICIVW